MSRDKITVALVGNPNSGKTVVFNALTGSRQRVGNWPGVTVERKEGVCYTDTHEIALVDLPGIYTTQVACEGAVDEKLTREYLLSCDADLIVNVVDGSNLVRNLYLTMQLLEMRRPVVVAVNMMDVVAKRGVALNLKQLEKQLGCKVVSMVASRGEGLEEVKQAVTGSHRKFKASSFGLTLTPTLRASLAELASEIATEQAVLPAKAHWLALRLLEQDCHVNALVSDSLKKTTQLLSHRVEQVDGEEPDTLIADARYRRVCSIAESVTTIKKSSRQSFTELVDRIVLNRFLGIPIFFVVMYLMFVFAINVGGAFQDFFDIGSSAIFVDGLTHLLLSWHCPVWLIALLANGFGKGVNTVVSFIPIIGAMFLFLSLLEDSGYMARAAFVMDRLMRALGLPGKSFVPMIIGFGCNVPAVMGARTLANRRDRTLTVMMMPFMSCGARLAIFSVFATAFFPHGGAIIIFTLYFTGILTAVLSGLVLRKTLLPGKPAPLVMELPSYHMPQAGSLGRHAWQRLKGFLMRAGKYIVPMCILVGVLGSISTSGTLVDQGSSNSVLAVVGRGVTPVFEPMGLKQDNWPATVGLATGILAKEVVVGTLNSLYANMADQRLQQEPFNFFNQMYEAVMSVPKNLSDLIVALANPIVASSAPHEMSKTAFGAMRARFDGTAGAFAYMLFVLLYFPCVSTMAAMWREVSLAWAIFSMVWSTGLAYVLAVIAYQLYTVYLHPLSSLLWLGGMLLVLIMAVLSMYRYAGFRQGSEGGGNQSLSVLRDG